MSIYYFPEDVMLEIFYRLPIRTLVICIAVCQAWCSLIKNSSFISNHLNKSIAFNNLTNTSRLLVRLCTFAFFNDHVRRLEHYLVCIDDVDPFIYDLEPPFNLGRLAERFHVAGTCNGLVCLAYTASHIHTYILWNPIIRKALVVPRPSVTFFFNCFLGFGFDSKTNDYKLLRFVQLGGPNEPKNSFEVELYSLNSNSWKRITPIASKYGIITQDGPNYGHSFVNGSIHFLATYKSWPPEMPRNLVLGFDVTEESFHEIPLPECLSEVICSGDTTLLKYRESSIALTFYTRSNGPPHMWAMTEYGDATSWTELNIDGILPETPKVVAFTHNGGVVMEVYSKIFGGQGGCLAYHDPISQEIEPLTAHLPLIYEQSFADSFVESLVLLDKGEYANAAMWNRIKDERSKDYKFNKSFTKDDASIVGRLLNFEGFKRRKEQLVNVVSKYWNAHLAKRN